MCGAWDQLLLNRWHDPSVHLKRKKKVQNIYGFVEWLWVYLDI